MVLSYVYSSLCTDPAEFLNAFIHLILYYFFIYFLVSWHLKKFSSSFIFRKDVRTQPQRASFYNLWCHQDLLPGAAARTWSPAARSFTQRWLELSHNKWALLCGSALRRCLQEYRPVCCFCHAFRFPCSHPLRGDRLYGSCSRVPQLLLAGINDIKLFWVMLIWNSRAKWQIITLKASLLGKYHPKHYQQENSMQIIYMCFGK